MGSLTITPEVMAVLKVCRCEANRVYLPALDRPLYKLVDDVLQRLGGKWVSGKTRAHVFEEDAAELLAVVLATGEKPLKNALAYYASPDPVIAELLSIATTAARFSSILEPSAGEGAIVREAWKLFPQAQITAIEWDPKRAAKLRALATQLQAEDWERGPSRVTVVEDDFLAWRSAARFDLVLANPPFAVERDAQEWRAHTRHAWECVAPEGLLVTIAPNSLTFAEDKRTSALRAELFPRVEEQIRKLPEGTFKASGTGVQTVIAWAHKPAAAPVVRAWTLDRAVQPVPVETAPYIYGDAGWRLL